MPSGAKKRKAAKKKKVVEESANSSSVTGTAPQGDDALKVQQEDDNKDPDGNGEVDSPASQDRHDSQHPFAEEEEEKEVDKREDTSSVQPVVSESKSVEGVESAREAALEEDEVSGVVQVDNREKLELKSDEDFESQNVIIESVKESDNGSSSGNSSSSSSSDDETHVIEKKTVAEETVAPAFESVKSVDYLSEVVTQVSEKVPTDFVVETTSVLDLEKVPLVEHEVLVNESASVDNSVAPGMIEAGLNESVESVVAEIVDSGSKENGEKKLCSVDDTGVPPVVMDLGSREEHDEAISASGNTVAASSDAKESDEKLLLSFNAPGVDTSNGAEHVKDSEAPECSDSQPLVASAPKTVQTTSWKGCCGILELFTGSHR